MHLDAGLELADWIEHHEKDRKRPEDRLPRKLDSLNRAMLQRLFEQDF